MVSIKDKLQIIIITYNRSSFLERTLSEITCISSPIRNFDILVLDNNSSDDTQNIVNQFQNKYVNISYMKNPYNVGAPANIIKAFEYNQKDYLWILADDDTFCWDNWVEVEKAINNNEKAIVVSRKDLPDEAKNDVSQILYQSAFNAAVIYSKQLLNDTVFHNMYNNVDSMFPHLVPLIYFINNSGNFYVLNKQIVEHGYYTKNHCEDAAYTRGTVIKHITKKLERISFPMGFCMVINDLDDKKLKASTIQCLFKNLEKFYNTNDYLRQFCKMNVDNVFLIELYKNVDNKNKKIIKPYIKKMMLSINPKIKNLKYYVYNFLFNITTGKTKEKYLYKKDKYSWRD